MNRPISYYRQGLAESRRREVARIDDMTAKDTTASGRQLFLNPGEATFHVTFPATFVKRPIHHFSPELDDGLSPVSGAFPGLHACVIGWDVINRIEGGFDGYFTGATVSVDILGDSDIRLWVCWNFRGIAMRNPVQVTELLEDTL